MVRSRRQSPTWAGATLGVGQNPDFSIFPFVEVSATFRQPDFVHRFLMLSALDGRYG